MIFLQLMIQITKKEATSRVFMKKGEHSEISLLSEIVLTMRIIWKLLDLYEFLGNYSISKNYQTIGNNSVSEGYEF